MMQPAQTSGGEMIPVAALGELKEKGVVVVPGADRPIAVFYNGGNPRAVDNRCPHMGFPMHKGSVKEGIVTCHWHEARFDLCSGCTFDLFADDLPAFDVQVRSGEVYVSTTPRHEATGDYYRSRLVRGMEQNISLVQGKAITGLLHGGTGAGEIVCQAARFASANHDNWQAGMTSLTAAMNLLGYLDEDTAYFAIFKAVSRVAADCTNVAPRRARHELGTSDHSMDTIKEWMRNWTLVRHRTGVERTLLTAVTNSATPQQLTDILFSSITDRPYAGTGHLLDFANKAFELLEHIGYEYASSTLPLVLQLLVNSRGGEETSAWRHPIDLIPPLRKAESQLAKRLEQGRHKTWNYGQAISEMLLCDDPLAIIDALGDALAQGAPPTELTKRICHAAAMRLARFAMTNDVRDWFGPVHTFTHCNALHQTVQRCQSPLVLRGIFHAAIAVYMDRFLNVPPAKLPGERDTLDMTPTAGDVLLEQLLAALDQRHQVDTAATIVVRYVRLGHPIRPLINQLVFAVVREDIDFHALQVIEAGVRQYDLWQGQPEAEHTLVAVVRYLASQCPTQRGGLQTARIALRLHRGDKIYEDDA